MIHIEATRAELAPSALYSSGKVATPGVGTALVTVPAPAAGLYFVHIMGGYQGAESIAGRIALHRGGVLHHNINITQQAISERSVLRLDGTQNVQIVSTYAFGVSTLAVSICLTRIGG